MIRCCTVSFLFTIFCALKSYSWGEFSVYPNSNIPGSFLLVKAPVKLLFWYYQKLHSNIPFTVHHVLKSYSWGEFWVYPNSNIPVSFLLVKAPVKFLFWYDQKLHCNIPFTILYVQWLILKRIIRVRCQYLKSFNCVKTNEPYLI